MEKSTVIAILLVTVSIVVIGVSINHNTVYKTNGSSIPKNEVNSNVVSFENDSLLAGSLKKRLSRSLPAWNSPNDYGYMNIYVRESCRNDSSYSHQQIRFPYARYDRHRLPLTNSWVRVSRWMPIFVDRITRQTIIYSVAGVYILPPLVNLYGKFFSVAQLVAYRYATFFRNGAVMLPNFNIASFANPGSYFGRGVPIFNHRIGGFIGGVHSNYRSSFTPDCLHDYDESTSDRQPSDDKSYDTPNKQNNYNNAPRSEPRPPPYGTTTKPIFISKTTTTTTKPITQPTTTESTTTTTESTTTTTESTSTTATTIFIPSEIISNNCTTSLPTLSTLLYLNNATAFNYTQYAFLYTTTAGSTQMTVSFAFQQDPTYWYLDDVYIIDTVTNLTVNNDPSFENGTLLACCTHCNTFISASSGIVHTSYTHSGTYAYLDGATGNPDYLFITTNSVGGRTYNVTFWLSNIGDTPNLALITINS